MQTQKGSTPLSYGTNLSHKPTASKLNPTKKTSNVPLLLVLRRVIPYGFMGQPQILAGKTPRAVLELGHLFFLNRSMKPIHSDSTGWYVVRPAAMCSGVFLGNLLCNSLLRERLKTTYHISLTAVSPVTPVWGRPGVDPLTWQKHCSLQHDSVPFMFLFIIFGNSAPLLSTGVEEKR